ncbi:MAG: MASE1 domain-containing protein [Polyangiales bacterium]
MDRPRPAAMQPEEAATEHPPTWAAAPWWAVALLFPPVYLFSILVGYAFYLTSDSISALWPASGVALATLTLTRYRMWPLIVALLTVVEVSIPRILSDADILAIASLSNVVEPIVGALLLRVIFGTQIDVSRFRHAVGLVVFAAILGPGVTSLLGAYQVSLLEPDIGFVAAWQVWWFGGALGVFVVAPVILAWANRSAVERLSKERSLELLTLGVMIIVVGVWILGAAPHPFRSILDFPFVAFPLLIWASLRFDVRIVTGASMLVAFFTVWNATLGRGPFTMIIAETIQANILAIQAFISTAVLSALFLSAALADRRRISEERAVLRAQVAEAQKLELVARLAGSVAHDFNNDLTIMMSWADFLENKAGDDPDVERAVSQISRAAQRAASITNQLLSFGRTPPGPKQTVAVPDLTPAWHSLLRPLFHGSRRLEVSADEDAGYVRADPHQLEQVLLNLAINARDAMPEGGALTIRASRVARIDPDRGSTPMMCITVRDEGEGMSSAVLDRIFEPFFTTKEDGRGTGLGLPSVQRIVRGLGGRIEVDSAPRRGTTFRLYLPTVEAPARMSEPPAPELGPATETILVVDDDDGVRDAVVLALESGGYTVLRAADGEEALEVVRAHGDIVDLVITDLNMPKAGGEALIKDLSTNHPALPVMVVSGYSSSDSGDLPDDVLFVPKPFSSQVLLSCVRQALTHPR